MNEPFSFGAPERRRFAMQFGYEMRPSFWQGVRSNAHLVIAAVGTAALLGVAGVALWLALPANDRQAIASPAQTVPAVPVKTTKIAPPTANATVAAAAPQAARKADAVSPAVAAKEANIPALAANDPRWSDANPEAASASTAAATSEQAASQPADDNAKPSVAAFAETAAKSDATTALSDVAASKDAATEDMDGAQTAAIPTPKPQVAAAAASEADDSQAKTEPQKASAATGRILKAVTMRAGPKQKAAAMLTVPAKTSVQVISCKKWCQIVYNGKRGWIYKTYIKTGA
ncbi:peptide-binding protein [Mesorhizobium amorphae]|uniref:SH3 type 3 domain-containing protein n=1 Tax=Mesorhizobium amorphae CCNWGS0123 TaxID=1082933 RepID=G6YBA5_9HYPH|nr:peptide-binding protein [Mesorhizobium amorphae CCNWGS0123]EHH10986.1 SH3 type 3 domain-containing protein [Mesorhizobium amorphae CCNWGS0123]GLR39744.1 peptide-binding protein [Mesorhizobium amorphae]